MKIDDINRFDIVEIGRESYIVLNILNMKDDTYFYLINEKEDKNDSSVVKVLEEDNNLTFIPIENDQEFDNVMSQFLLSNKKLLDELENQ